ncbi:hypothetical protein C8R43DRAFT_75458 [Mycena crocata]|nr:hypothetical protein C8R43DRAFT_75458 [Mycena crocata]
MVSGTARVERGEESTNFKSNLERWQKEAIQACIKSIQAGRTRIGMYIPGRRNTICALLGSLPSSNPGVTQVLVVVPSVKRAQRVSAELNRQYPHWRIEVDAKGGKSVASNADVFLTCLPNMAKERRVKTYIHPKLKAIILSEAHRLKPSFFELIASANAPQPPIVIGTSSIEDSNALRRLDFFEDIVSQRNFLDSLQETWECGARFSAVSLPLVLQKLKTIRGTDLQVEAVSSIMSRPPFIRATVQAWLDTAATRRSTLVFCADDNHAQKLRDAFQEVGVDARLVSELAAFTTGDFPVVVVTQPDTQVISVPRIDCVVLASPTLDRHALGRMILSGMKESPDTQKEDTLVIDVVDGSRKRSHQTSVYSTCDLLHLDAHEIDGQPLDVLRRRAEEKARLELELAKAPPSIKAPERPKMNVLLLPASDELSKQALEEEKDKTLERIRLFFKKRLWVRCDSGIYVYDCLNKGHVVLRKTKDSEEGEALYEAYWMSTRLESDEPPSEPARKLSLPDHLDHVFERVGDYLHNNHPPRLKHRLHQATPPQLTALRDFCPGVMSHALYEGKPMATDLFFEWLNVETASNALVRLRYGPNPDLCFTYHEQAAVLNAMNSRVRDAWQIDRRSGKEMREAREAKREDRYERRRLEGKARVEEMRASADKDADKDAVEGDETVKRKLPPWKLLREERRERERVRAAFREARKADLLVNPSIRMIRKEAERKTREAAAAREGRARTRST